MLYRRFIVTALVLFAAGFAQAGSVHYSFLSEDGHYNFDGGFTIEADPSVVWAVLTDYNHFNSYISNLKAKVLSQKPGEDIIVEQDAGGGFLFIQEHIKARLDIHEIPGESISFQDIDHLQFSIYAGVWTLHFDPELGEVSVGYVLQASRNKMTPDFLTADLFGSSLGDLLNEMNKEMERREVKRRAEIALVLPTVSPTPAATIESPQDKE